MHKMACHNNNRQSRSTTANASVNADGDTAIPFQFSDRNPNRINTAGICRAFINVESITFNVIALAIIQVELEGLTGDIRFNEDGRRENYTLSIVEMSSNSDMVKVAEWSDRARLTPTGNRLERTSVRNEYERNRTYVVTTIIEEPYIMVKKTKFDTMANERDKYVGYCKDLADKLAERLGINCEYEANTQKKNRKQAKNRHTHTHTRTQFISRSSEIVFE